MAESEIERLCQATYIGESLKTYNFRTEISENMLITPFCSRYIVDIYDRPVSFERFKSFDPDIRSTKAEFTIKYFPKNHKHRVKDKPFVIGQDLIRWRVAVSGPAHWRALCSRVPELAWIQRNTTLTNAYFGIARKHPGLMIKFTIDFPRYCDMITKKAEEQGIDIDNNPLVAYQCSYKDFENKYSKKQLSEPRSKADYMHEITEVESVAVQEYRTEEDK